MLNVYEGNIIRALKQEEELLRQLSQGAQRLGYAELALKFAEAGKAMKKDIVFAASLYL
jgi:ATP-dependent RNA helicase DOB1